MPIHIEFDAVNDAAYIRLRETGPDDLRGPSLVLSRDRAFAGQLILADFTFADGRLVGLEVHDASACLPAELLGEAERHDHNQGLGRFQERFERVFGSVELSDADLLWLKGVPAQDLPPVTDVTREERDECLVMELGDFIDSYFTQPDDKRPDAE